MSLPPSKFFPPADDAGPDGLIGVGGRLTPEWLLDAYSHGIFPWPTGHDDRLIPWCSPDPRAIIELDRFHIARRLSGHVAAGSFARAWTRILPASSRHAPRRIGRGGTWLIPSMIRAYTRLAQLGHAHSVEAGRGTNWRAGCTASRLAGCLPPSRCSIARGRLESRPGLPGFPPAGAGLRPAGHSTTDPHTARFGARDSAA